jgi:beta-galactosidase
MQQPFPGTFLYGGDYNPEQWSEEIWHEDMRLMQLAHINMVSINIFSWALLEPEPEHYYFEQLDRIMDMLEQHGINADLATATASPPTWMSRLYPSMLPVTYEGLRMSQGSRQHYCPNSPDYRRKAAALVQRLAERYARHPALKMWHVNNEYGCHTWQCYCENCTGAFRTWLQNRYHTLERLNDAWGTTFWSQRYYHWEDVLPPRMTPAQNNPAQRLDYWRFMSDSLLECYRIEEEILRKVTPGIPLTTNLMVAHKPVDAYAWAKHMDIVSFDMYPPVSAPAWKVALPHDIMRSARGGQPHLVMEQSPSQVNWRPQNPHKRPGQMRLHSIQALAHGANGVLFFQWRQSRAGAEKFHSAVVSHEGNEHTRIFKQAAQVGAELQKLAPEVANSRIQAQAALLMDWQNWWEVEYLPGPSDRLHYWQQLELWYHALHDLNISVDVVEPDSDLSNYRLVIAPLLHMVRPGVASHLEHFVEHGGTLLMTFYSGIVDQDGRVTLTGYPGQLRKLLGIHVEEFDPLTAEMTNQVIIEEGTLQGTYDCSVWGELIHLEGAQAIGVFAQDYYANEAALTVNKFGQGHAYYIATQGNEELTRKLVQDLCKQAQVKPVLETPAGVEATRRIRDDGRSVYFVLNYTSLEQRVALPAGTFTSLLNDKQVENEAIIGPMDVAVLLEPY